MYDFTSIVLIFSLSLECLEVLLVSLLRERTFITGIYNNNIMIILYLHCSSDNRVCVIFQLLGLLPYVMVPVLSIKREKNYLILLDSIFAGMLYYALVVKP